VLPIYGKELGASAVEIGGFFSAFSIIPVVVRPFLGRVLDRWGRRPFLLIGLGGYLFSVVVFAGANSVLLLTVARFIQGLGAAFLWISALTVVADVAQESGRGHEFGSINEAANRGAIIGTTGGFILIIILSNMGIPWSTIWPVLFGCYAVPAFLGFWRGYRGVQETKPEEIDPLSKPRSISRQLLTLMVIVMITGASTTMVWPLLMIFLQDKLNAEVWALATAYLPAAILGAFLPSRLGIIADRFGRKPPMVMGLIIGAAATAIIPSLRNVYSLALLWAVESLGYMAATPAERAFVADIAGEDVRGTSYGLYTFAFFLGGVIGPLFGGWLYDNLGHASPFYLNSVVLLVAALLVSLLLKETRSNANMS
jgi:MFS family permease